MEAQLLPLIVLVQHLVRKYHVFLFITTTLHTHDVIQYLASSLD